MHLFWENETKGQEDSLQWNLSIKATIEGGHISHIWIEVS